MTLQIISDKRMNENKYVKHFRHIIILKAEANKCVLSCFLKVVWIVEHDVTESGKEF